MLLKNVNYFSCLNQCFAEDVIFLLRENNVLEFIILN